LRVPGRLINPRNEGYLSVAGVERSTWSLVAKIRALRVTWASTTQRGKFCASAEPKACRALFEGDGAARPSLTNRWHAEGNGLRRVRDPASPQARGRVGGPSCVSFGLPSRTRDKTSSCRP